MRAAGLLAFAALAACAPPDGTVGEQEWAVAVERGLESEARARVVDGRVFVSDVGGLEVRDASGALLWSRTDLGRLEAYLPRGDKTLATGWIQEPTPTSWFVQLDATGAETWRVKHQGLLLEQHLEALPDDGFLLSANAYEGAVLEDGTAVAGYFLAAFDAEGQPRWLRTVEGSIDALATTDAGDAVMLATSRTGQASLVGVAADGAETWSREAPLGATLGRDRLGRWIVAGCGDVMVVGPDGTVAWRKPHGATTCFDAGGIRPSSDSMGRIALPERASLGLRDPAGEVLWRTEPFGDETYSIAEVVPTGDDGWLVLAWITPNLGYAVEGQTRIYAVDRDGVVSDPEIFRGGSIASLLVDGAALRIFGYVSGTMSYGPGELTGQGAFVLGRTL